MDVNVIWLQKLWPLLRQSGPLINRLADAYVKRGADKKTAESLASTAVIVDQVLEERLRDMARQEDLQAVRRELAELRSVLESHGVRRRPPMWAVLLLGELVIIALLLYLGLHG